MSSLNAYIVDAVRTPGGKKNGSIAKIHPTDLGALVLNALVDRNNFDPALIDDVIFGCLSQLGAQSINVARNCVLASKLPISVPATTVDRQCGSSLQAFHFAAQAVMSGTQDIVIAGGVELMSLVPIGSAVTVKPAFGLPKGKEMEKKMAWYYVFSI
jgi:acetyl-CoA acetyltransferase